MNAPLQPLIDTLVQGALLEDLQSGDITTDSVVPETAQAVAVIRAREACVVCGEPVVVRTFQAVDGATRVETNLNDSERAQAGDAVWTIRGNARSLLKAERTALNFAQRLSGIATQSAEYVAQLAPGSKTRIVDTRKTTPLLRALERYAVRTGGAHNHRDNLGSGVLIKDNHIAATGGVQSAITAARRSAPHSARIEVEVDTLVQFDEALAGGADIILLDNFDNEAVAEAMQRNEARAPTARAILEASGGITLDRVQELSRLGVDVISVGALTHSVRAVDLGLDFEVMA